MSYPRTYTSCFSLLSICFGACKFLFVDWELPGKGLFHRCTSLFLPIIKEPAKEPDEHKLKMLPVIQKLMND